MIKNLALDRDQINFNMNLRNYKNTSNFGADKPFKYPPPKAFSPKDQLQHLTDGIKNRNTEFKNRFKDKLGEKNANEIMHMARRNDVYGNTQWMTNLRGDRDDKIPKANKEAH